MDFELYSLSDELVFVRWLRPADALSEKIFLDLAEMLLDEACGRVYFLHDLSDGALLSNGALLHMEDLAQHPNWGGKVFYGHMITSTAYVDVFDRATSSTALDDEVYSIEEALDLLERQQPGITTRSIDRQALELLYG